MPRVYRNVFHWDIEHGAVDVVAMVTGDDRRLCSSTCWFGLPTQSHLVITQSEMKKFTMKLKQIFHLIMTKNLSQK